MRKIAERTIRATKEIGSTIRETQNDTARTATLIHGTLGKVEESRKKVDVVGTVFESIATHSMVLSEQLQSIVEVTGTQSRSVSGVRTQLSQLLQDLEKIMSGMLKTRK